MCSDVTAYIGDSRSIYAGPVRKIVMTRWNQSTLAHGSHVIRYEGFQNSMKFRERHNSNTCMKDMTPPPSDHIKPVVMIPKDHIIAESDLFIFNRAFVRDDTNSFEEIASQSLTGKTNHN